MEQKKSRNQLTLISSTGFTNVPAIYWANPGKSSTNDAETSGYLMEKIEL